MIEFIAGAAAAALLGGRRTVVHNTRTVETRYVGDRPSSSGRRYRGPGVRIEFTPIEEPEVPNEEDFEGLGLS